MTRIPRAAALAVVLLVVAVPPAVAAPVTYPDATSFRTAIGPDRKEINWDDAAAGNGTVARTRYQAATGALLDSPSLANTFSARATAWPELSADNVMTIDGSTVVDITFTVPGSSRPAGVNSFGVAFSDVDVAGGSYLTFYD